MKKVLITAGVVTLALAMVVSAQGFAFNTNLTVGSTGQGVVALQTLLMSAGYSIPSIASGAASTGYFGSQTKAAVVKYQGDNGIPTTGFVGPLTRAALNGSTVATACPAGLTCTPNTAPVTTCPVGYTCTLIGSTVPVQGAPAGITTIGAAGILSASLWSSPSGVSVYKGSAYDVGSYKLQAGASDMAVSGFTFDFDNYIWLYANTITLKDETGAVVGTVNNLNYSSFVELTAGSQYRITVPASFVVKAATSKYITVNLGFLSSSDRCPAGSCALSILGASVRSVDGTGVTDTETVASARSFTYQGSNNGQVYVKTDSSLSPAVGNVQISTAVNTNMVLLGVFDVKSANVASKLQSLAVNINTNGTVSSLFGTISIQVGGQTYSASLLDTPNASTTVAHFTSLTIPLLADVWTPVSVYANVNSDTVGALNGKSASTTISAAGTAGASTNNPGIIDNSFNTLLVNTANPFSNVLTFTASGVSQSGLSKSVGNVAGNTGASSTQTFTFAYTLTAGNNPIYVDSTPFTSAVTVSDGVTGAGVTVANVSFRDNDTTGDGSGYFYVDAGNTKTFTITNVVTGTPGAAHGTYSVTALKYGTGFSAGSVTGAGSLSAPTIANTLSADIAF